MALRTLRAPRHRRQGGPGGPNSAGCLAYSSHMWRAWRGGAALAVVFAAGVARAERLPIRTYTTADGLARDTITGIVPDSLGYLWFLRSEEHTSELQSLRHLVC